MVEAHPLEGVGAGNFHTSSIHYLLVQPGLLRRSDFIADTQKVAHNVYLQTWAELGAIGLALLLILVFAVLRSGFQAIRAFEKLGNLQMEILARAQVIAVDRTARIPLFLIGRVQETALAALGHAADDARNRKRRSRE